MKKYFLLLLSLIVIVNIHGQAIDTHLPVFSLKTNIIYLATTTFNLGVEAGLSKKITLNIPGNYNPWHFPGGKRIKHWLVQPEIRYWFCERFYRHFIGIHGHYAVYNFGGVKFLGMENRRYQGTLYGGGITYGYHWILGDRWSLEAEIGAGYARLDDDKYLCKDCGIKVKEEKKDYFGITKLGLNLLYFFR